jgi:alkylhydroperoxidase family enzyme
MSARIAPATPPYPADVKAKLDRIMRGKPALALFATLARDSRLFHKFFSAGLLDRGHLTLRQREIVIMRTTALCQSEYEWGVHVSAFADHAGLTGIQLRSLATGTPNDSCWSAPERQLLRMCDALHIDCTVSDEGWAALAAEFPDNALIELLMLAGFYRTVSYLTNALRLPLEPDSAVFPARVR